MTESILASEPTVRVSVFLLTLVVIALAEALAPRRTRSVSRSVRWPANFGVVVLNTLIVRLLAPTAAVGAAFAAAQNGFGLLNQFDPPYWLAFVVSVLVLDLAVYLQHVVFHAVPVLWRVHRMHHADLDFDVTTGIRFHPIEIAISMLFKFVVVFALGAPALAVLTFEILLNATSLFNHSNLKIGRSIDRVLRWLLVTPDMHRVHHSVKHAEMNSNFGFNAPWWDRLFGTYRAQPDGGHHAMTIGLNQFRSADNLRFGRMLLQPFQPIDP